MHMLLPRLRICLFVFGLFSLTILSAQDKIITTTGDTIACKVMEVGDRAVHYKLWSNLTGPTQDLEFTKIYQIQYESGEVKTYTLPVKSKEVEKNTSPFGKNWNLKRKSKNKARIPRDNSGYWKNRFYLGSGYSIAEGIGFSAGYERSFSKRWSMELEAGFGNGSYSSMQTYQDPFTGQLYRELSYYEIYSGGVCATFHFAWYNSRVLKLSTGLGVGVGFLEYDDPEDTYEGIGGQFDLLSVKWNFAKHFGMYLDIGAGHISTGSIGVHATW